MNVRVPAVLEKTGVFFKDSSLLVLALTHPSNSKIKNNQRLEFLGDRVLGLVLADILYRTYPIETEGALALRHAALVRAGMLADIARRYELFLDIITPESERLSGASSLDNVLADTLEALIGALYLDQGYSVCVSFIDKLWNDDIRAMIVPPRDPKNTLQEWAQGKGLPLPVYHLVDRSGADHNPVFCIEVFVHPDHRAAGRGPNRRTAEKQAASALLEKILKKGV